MIDGEPRGRSTLQKDETDLGSALEENEPKGRGAYFSGTGPCAAVEDASLFEITPFERVVASWQRSKKKATTQISLDLSPCPAWDALYSPPTADLHFWIVIFSPRSSHRGPTLRIPTSSSSPRHTRVLPATTDSSDASFPTDLDALATLAIIRRCGLIQSKERVRLGGSAWWGGGRVEDAKSSQGL